MIRILPVLAIVLAAPAMVGAAELIGYAVLDAESLAPGPPSGAFSRGGERGAPRFASQPVQGFSAIRPLGGAAFLVLSDNGYGTRKNSPDYLLRVYTIRHQLRTAQGGAGTIAVEWTFVQLRDPDRKATFLLVNESTSDRLLTGGDFDPESLAVAPDGTLWIGEEFGPFLLHFDATGRLLEPPIPVPDPRPGRDPTKDFVRSPDNPFLIPPAPGAPNAATLNRSKGVESMALGPNGARLYLMLEGPLAGDPPELLRLLEFDRAAGRFTGRSWSYRMSAAAHAVRDMAAVSDTEFLVIEGDEGHGPKAHFKKIFLITLTRTDGQGAVAKEEVADLMNIRDPHNLGGVGPKFTFPHWTIEGVTPLDATTIVVVNDNNYPATGARRADVRDPSELLLLRLDRPLNLDPRLVVK